MSHCLPGSAQAPLRDQQGRGLTDNETDFARSAAPARHGVCGAKRTCPPSALSLLPAHNLGPWHLNYLLVSCRCSIQASAWAPSPDSYSHEGGCRCPSGPGTRILRALFSKPLLRAQFIKQLKVWVTPRGSLSFEVNGVTLSNTLKVPRANQGNLKGAALRQNCRGQFSAETGGPLAGAPCPDLQRLQERWAGLTCGPRAGDPWRRQE